MTYGVVHKVEIVRKRSFAPKVRRISFRLYNLQGVLFFFVYECQFSYFNRRYILLFIFGFYIKFIQYFVYYLELIVFLQFLTVAKVLKLKLNSTKLLKIFARIFNYEYVEVKYWGMFLWTIGNNFKNDKNSGVF